MKSVLLDASNLHVGGGIQVAISFLDELSALASENEGIAKWLTELRVEISTEIESQLQHQTRLRLATQVVDRRPLQLRYWIPRTTRFDVSFVIFGPEYGKARAKRRIIGFADGTSVFGFPESLSQPSAIKQVQRRVRARVSRYLHSKADILVVESQFTADALHSTGIVRSGNKVVVVPNTINGIFNNPQLWEQVVIPARPIDSFTLCYVARGYDHKNHKILSSVARTARQSYGMTLNFVVTLTHNEWDLLGSEYQYGLVNVGEIRIAQVPNLLLRCDAAVFPDLSPSPSPLPPSKQFTLVHYSSHLTASLSGRIAVTRPAYFDPTSPSHMARMICETVRDPQLIAEHKARGTLVASVAFIASRSCLKLPRNTANAVNADLKVDLFVPCPIDETLPFSQEGQL